MNSVTIGLAVESGKQGTRRLSVLAPGVRCNLSVTLLVFPGLLIDQHHPNIHASLMAACVYGSAGVSNIEIASLKRII